MGDLVPFRKSPERRQRRSARGAGLPPVWQPHLRRRGANLAEIRMMVWAGLLLGLLAWQAARLWVPSAVPETVASAPAGDPWEESRRSRAILKGQEGAPRPAATGERPVVEAAAAIRVIDGDTFDHGGMRIRIADIDTPELRGRCAYETALAARATRRLRALLAEAPFDLHPADGADEDRYGRKLRIVTQGGRSVGDMPVAEGLARTWAGRREPWCP